MNRVVGKELNEIVFVDGVHIPQIVTLIRVGYDMF